MIGPPGQEYEQHCDAVTMSGGHWEVWCSVEGVYLWARFESVSATGSYTLCPNAPGMFANSVWYEAGVAGQGTGGTLPIDTYTIDLNPPVDVTIDKYIPDPEFGTERGSRTVARALARGFLPEWSLRSAIRGSGRGAHLGSALSR